ncbi:sensor histidine kinase [Lentzea sp. NPDC051213]|uniref:sensor histidine kinase n=1 Tax=Lentzea sp. NPDC051213 TaxID=3364126 RepID=UPI0037B009DD
MTRTSFRARVFLLVIVVAAVAAGATAWLTVWQASQQLTRASTIAHKDVDRVVSEITTFGLLQGSWHNADTLVREQAARIGERVRLMTTDGEQLADSDPSASATPPHQTVTIDTHRAPPLTGFHPENRSLAAAYALSRYRSILDYARCWQRHGFEVVAVPDPDGSYDFVQPPQVSTGEACTTEALITPTDFEEVFATACGPDQEIACLRDAYVEQVSTITPPPVLVLIGALDQPKPAEIPLRPALAAAAFVALIVMAVSLLISRRVLRPIGALASASRRLGEGDLTERVPERGRDELTQLTRSFNRMAESLQRSKDQQHNMIADIAHELRTPLANIRGYLEAFKDGVFPPDPESLASLYEEAMLQQRLLDDLQELALAESGSLVYHPSRTDLTELLQACRTAHASSAAVREVVIDVSAPSTVVAVIDPERIRQVLGNLVTNALRATPVGGRITLSLRAERGFAVIEVADTGSGIAADDLPHVFDRFWRADTARGRETGGRGLGLAIAREIIAAHRGTISVTSTPGTGTVFTVRLPLDQSTSDDAARAVVR